MKNKNNKGNPGSIRDLSNTRESRALENINKNTALSGGILYALNISHKSGDFQARGVSESKLSLKVQQEIIREVDENLKIYSQKLPAKSSYPELDDYMFKRVGVYFAKQSFKKQGMKTILSGNYSEITPNYIGN